MSSETKYVCFLQNCEETFKTIGEVKFHLRNIHCLQSADHYMCCVPYCLQAFSSFKNFSRHMKTCVKNSSEALDDGFTLEGNTKSTSIIHNECLMPVESLNVSSISLSKSTLLLTTLPQTICETDSETCEEKSDTFFTAKYVSRNNITRADIHEIQGDVQKCITDRIGKMIRTNVLNKLRSGSFSSSELISALEEILEICEEPFKNINTEYKFFQYMENNDLFHKPTNILLSETIVPMVVDYECTLDSKSTHVNLQDLDFQFRKFFELPGVLEETLQNMNELEQKGDINNFINGKLFKGIKIRYNQDDTIIPYNLYWDDFEINNPLGLLQ